MCNDTVRIDAEEVDVQRVLRNESARRGTSQNDAKRIEARGYKIVAIRQSLLNIRQLTSIL